MTRRDTAGSSSRRDWLWVRGGHVKAVYRDETIGAGCSTRDDRSYELQYIRRKGRFDELGLIALGSCLSLYIWRRNSGFRQQAASNSTLITRAGIPTVRGTLGWDMCVFHRFANL